MNKKSFQQERERLLELIIHNAYFREKIILSSGKESDYYIDARRVTLSPEGAYLCAKIILDMIKDEHIDAIGGPTIGADPMVGAIASLSHQSGKPINTFIIRKQPKAHGKQQQVEGPLLKEGASVVIIDDVATTGKAFIHSIDALAQDGLKPAVCVCIIDRQDGAKEALLARGIALRSLYTAAQFLQD